MASILARLKCSLRSVFLLVAAVIFLRKSDTWIGMLTALLLVTYGVTQTDASALAAAVPAWSIPANVVQPLSFILLMLFLFLFPKRTICPLLDSNRSAHMESAIPARHIPLVTRRHRCPAFRLSCIVVRSGLSLSACFHSSSAQPD